MLNKMKNKVELNDFVVEDITDENALTARATRYSRRTYARTSQATNRVIDAENARHTSFLTLQKTSRVMLVPHHR